MEKEIRKEIANVLIIFISVFLIAFGLKFKPSLRFVEFIIALILPALIILKFGEVFSKTEVLASIFVTGLIVNTLIGIIILQTRDIRTGMFLLSLMPLTLVFIPSVFATSLLLRYNASRKEAFAFYVWFLVSVGLAILFLLPTGHVSTTTTQPKNSIYPLISFYITLTAIPSVLCYIYKHVKTFLIFLPMPLLLGYALLYLLG